ncbi:MAG TPA: NB-ARC domain-containing protein, partial [Anaerolineae bacterium]|nr:NB-ARC domain-containing protein [Anaerolineae bacterium]
GNIAKVAATFERCVEALRNDLNVEPSEQTRELYRKLVKEQSAAAAISVTSSNKRTSNIPIPLTSFIGRERQIEDIKALLTKSRLVTLTGAGGSGKTRLAVQVATDLVNTFEDGVRWVELAALKDAALVPQAVAKVLDVREGPNQPLSETLVHDLRTKQVLLVLDNCEHVIAACAQLAEMLLHSCPNLRILTTSVEKLRISGETVRLVPSLSVPRSEVITSLEEVNQSEAARLFIERATAILPTFSLNLQQAALVVKICQHLSGIPLAIELAAARVNMLSLEEIVKRLGDRFRLLVDGGRITIAKHQTLRATMDWSYELLGEQERILFQRLSVFAGGLSLEAAEAVCSGEKLNQLDILNLVGHLVDKSLVSVDAQINSQSGQTRYRLQETIRAYAHEKLDDSGETERLRKQHRDYFIAFAEEAEPKLKSAEQFDWLDRLEAEHDNLRAAWEYAIESDADLALRLASALLDFWSMRVNPGEGRLWLAQLIHRTNQWGSTARR